MHLTPDVNPDRAAGQTHLVDSGVGNREQVRRVRQKSLPRICQSHAARKPINEFLAEQLLEAQDALGQGLLGEIQLSSRPPEMAVLGHSGERTNLGEIKVHPPILRQGPRPSNSYGLRCYTHNVTNISGQTARAVRGTERAAAAAGLARQPAVGAVA